MILMGNKDVRACDEMRGVGGDNSHSKYPEPE